jgi:hypothetical protein
MKAKRRSLSPKARAALLTVQGGVCAVRGCAEPATIAEHWTPVALGNASAPDCMLCAEHAKAKTYGEPGRIGGDIRDIAHTKRIANENTQYDKRKRGGSKMQSRGFDKTKTKGFNGEVRDKK